MFSLLAIQISSYVPALRSLSTSQDLVTRIPLQSPLAFTAIDMNGLVASIFDEMMDTIQRSRSPTATPPSSSICSPSSSPCSSPTSVSSSLSNLICFFLVCSQYLVLPGSGEAVSITSVHLGYCFPLVMATSPTLRPNLPLPSSASGSSFASTPVSSISTPTVSSPSASPSARLSYSFSQSSLPADFSLAFWIHVISPPSPNFRLLCFRGSFPQKLFSPCILFNKCDYYMQVHLTLTSSEVTSITSLEPVALNEWTHVLVTASRFELVLYVNGKISASKALMSPPKPLPSGQSFPLYFGQVRIDHGPMISIFLMFSTSSCSFLHCLLCVAAIRFAAICTLKLMKDLMVLLEVAIGFPM